MFCLEEFPHVKTLSDQVAFMQENGYTPLAGISLELHRFRNQLVGNDMRLSFWPGISGEQLYNLQLFGDCYCKNVLADSVLNISNNVEQ